MKIGLVLFGHLRSYRQTLTSFNSLRKTLQRSGDFDVFCHTWDIEESVTASWWKEHKLGDSPPATVKRNEIEEFYRPTRCNIEPSLQFDDSNFSIKSSIPVAGTLSMLHTQQRAFELLKQYELEKGFRYDVVLKARYDLLYEIAPRFNETIKACSTNSIVYLPSSNPYELIGSSSDIFAVGNGIEMEKYFSFCSKFREAIDLYEKEGYNEFTPEFCMTVYLDKIGVNRKELKDLRIHILRKSGEKFQINTDKFFLENGPLCFYKGTIEIARKVLSKTPGTIDNNSFHLAKKYVSWIDSTASEDLYLQYADFYLGKWIKTSLISRLARKGKNNPVFTPNVMKNFFEEAMRNASYGSLKKLILAIILLLRSGYGFFYFRVWKNIKN
jgi:hypothetical protein